MLNTLACAVLGSHGWWASRQGRQKYVEMLNGQSRSSSAAYGTRG